MVETRVGLGAVISLVVGSVIGSGIFILPALMTATLPSPGWVVAAFLGGAVVSIFGALTLAELGGMFPAEGGQYIYLRETLGRPWAFLFAWTSFWVVQTGVIAAVSLAFGRFAGLVFGYDDPLTTAFVAVAGIVALTGINVLGLKQGVWVQNLLTITKVGGILLLVIVAFLAGLPDHAWFGAAATPTGLDFVSLFGLAALAGIFAYDGWYVVTYIAGEVRDPQRTIPVGLVIGMLVVAGVYLLAVLAYFWILPVDEVARIGADGNSRIAAEAARAVLGPLGAVLVAVLVMASTLGATNGQVLTGPRLYAAVAHDGLFWHPFGKRSGRRNSPVHGLVYQGEWAALLVMFSVTARDAYLVIVNSVVFAIWLWFLPTAWGYFRLRRRDPQRPRPYRAFGHPIVPGLFFAAATAIVVNAIVTDARRLADSGLASLPELSALWALLLMAIGIPIGRRALRNMPAPST